jgi:hypothetical protein
VVEQPVGGSRRQKRDIGFVNREVSSALRRVQGDLAAVAVMESRL